MCLDSFKVHGDGVCMVKVMSVEQALWLTVRMYADRVLT